VTAAATPLLEAVRLCKRFASGPSAVDACVDISLAIQAGACIGVVGESGSGKSTLARMLVGLEQPTSGSVKLRGETLAHRASAAERRRRARVVQIVFQDPYTSLDPRQTVTRALDEIQRLHFERSRDEREERTRELLEAVGLSDRIAGSLPRELSGGQRQRVAIARALAAEPALVVLDEAVSALDVSIQAQILNLLADLRRRLSLAYMLISHDLAVVRQLADDVLVMYRGRAVEHSSTDRILSAPTDPYTVRLLEAVPRPGRWLSDRMTQGAAR
jgi:peptide/nickel transport system ATP-binding protein